MSDYNQKLVKIQNVFEKVISVGMFYGDHNDSSRFMCHALERSLGHGYITQEEYDLAVEDIRDVLHTAQTLTGVRVSSAIRDAIESCVNLKILPKSYHQYINDRKPLYQNWATLRPFKEKTIQEQEQMIYKFEPGHRFHRYGYDFNREQVVSFVQNNDVPRYLADYGSMRLNGNYATKAEVCHAAQSLIASFTQADPASAAEQAEVQSTTSNVNTPTSEPVQCEVAFPASYVVVDEFDDVITSVLTAESKESLMEYLREEIFCDHSPADISVRFLSKEYKVNFSLGL